MIIKLAVLIGTEFQGNVNQDHAEEKALDQRALKGNTSTNNAPAGKQNPLVPRKGPLTNQ